MGILVALLTVLGAGVIVCIKRKSLLGLLFTSKKNPIEKLRCLPPPFQNVTVIKSFVNVIDDTYHFSFF